MKINHVLLMLLALERDGHLSKDFGIFVIFINNEYSDTPMLGPYAPHTNTWMSSYLDWVK